MRRRASQGLSRPSQASSCSPDFWRGDFGGDSGPQAMTPRLRRSPRASDEEGGPRSHRPGPAATSTSSPRPRSPLTTLDPSPVSSPSSPAHGPASLGPSHRPRSLAPPGPRLSAPLTRPLNPLSPASLVAPFPWPSAPRSSAPVSQPPPPHKPHTRPPPCKTP